MLVNDIRTPLTLRAHNRRLLMKPLYSDGSLHLPPNTTVSTHRLKRRGTYLSVKIRIKYIKNTASSTIHNIDGRFCFKNKYRGFVPTFIIKQFFVFCYANSAASILLRFLPMASRNSRLFTFFFWGRDESM